LTVAEWLVAQGVRHLALMGRSAPSEAAIRVVGQLEEAGSRVLLVRGDVADRGTVARTLEQIDATMPPLGGVIHAAGVLDDGLLLRLDDEHFRRVMDGKAAGAWNLHTLTAERSLDCFVMFSSAASLLGAPAQANYAAANAFLDALAQYRRARGLPALSINWGPWAEIGLAARPNRATRLSLRGVDSLSPAQGLEALDHLLRHDATQVGVLRLNLRQWQEFYPKVAEAPLLSLLLTHDLQADRNDRENSALRTMLLEAEPSRRLAILERHLQEQLGQVLRLSPSRIDNRTPLSTLGLDSLMALELRNRLEASLGVTLSATLVWNYPTIGEMAPFLGDRMRIPLPGPGDTPHADTASESTDDLLAIVGRAGALSEEELQRLLSHATSEKV
jgi:acyl carrier protein